MSNPTPNLYSEAEVRRQLYQLMDSFLVEANDQNGNQRSLARLNQDRYLFMDQSMDLIRQQNLALLDNLLEYKHNIHPGFGECVPVATIQSLRAEIGGKK